MNKAAAALVGIVFVAATAHALDGASPSRTAPLATRAEAVSPEGIEVAGWDAGATRTASAPGAWGGERPSFGNDGQPLSERVASYELKATLDPQAHTVEGSEHLRWKNRSDLPVKSLYFHLYLNGFEGAGSTFMKEKALLGAFRSGVDTKKGQWGSIDLRSVTQAPSAPSAGGAGQAATFTFVHPDGGAETDHSVVRVDLPTAIAPGATGEIDIAFHDQLPRVIARTGYFAQYHLIGQWFPKVGVLELAGERGAKAPRWNCHEFHLNSEFYADFGNYRAELTAPKDYLVRATGTEQGAPTDAPGGLTHVFTQDDVHDFVWTAWNGYAAPLAGSYDGAGSPHVEVEVLYPPEYLDSARDALRATLDSLKYFSETLGPYPYPHLTVVVPPYNAEESGGMEYETFFTTLGGNGVLRDVCRFVTVHEFGHGYFMGLLASNEFEEPFLDEGMNETWDTRLLADEEVHFHLPEPAGFLGVSPPGLRYADYERSGGTRRFQADPIAGNSWDRYSEGSYTLVYPRTVLVFDDLDKRLGGDALARGMKLYYKRWHHRHPGTADLRDALAEGSGQAALVNDWFERQVYRNEPIDDRVVTVDSDEILPQAGTAIVDGKRVETDQDDVDREVEAARKAKKESPFPYRSTIVVRRYEGHVPQTVTVTFADGTKELFPLPVEERWHRFVIERPQKVLSAQIDPARAVLLDLDKLDDGRTRETDKRASTRWALEASNLAELALSLLVTQ